MLNLSIIITKIVFQSKNKYIHNIFIYYWDIRVKGT